VFVSVWERDRSSSCSIFVEKILEKQSKRHKDFNFGGRTKQRAT
jgi:hypothetical protein